MLTKQRQEIIVRLVEERAAEGYEDHTLCRKEMFFSTYFEGWKRDAFYDKIWNKVVK